MIDVDESYIQYLKQMHVLVHDMISAFYYGSAIMLPTK